MDAERWQRVAALFHEALEQPAAARAAFLEEACQGDAALRADVDALLTGHREAGAFGETPVALSSAMAALPMGAVLGAYRIATLLGAGGMGEVYRARDTRLGRDVAIKILPRAFTTDVDRLARFEREARVLAALNHPNIATIYGVEGSDGVRALVMELVEGDTLAEPIARGPLPISDALRIARQIAEALEAAHEKGIIHRDLKPANIKVRPDGTVKVLDFGLAKLAPGGGIDGGHSEVAMAAADGTREGVIVGTAAYTSPEQARGQAVDKRTDIWAFGCVVYEMLTGRRAFVGEDASDTFAAVLRGEPDWRLLPADTPAAVRRLLRRCLQKDAKDRLHDISDARIEMQEAQAEASEATTVPVPVVARRPRERLAWAVAAIAVVIAALALVASGAYFRRAPAELPPVRFTIGPPENGLFSLSTDFLQVSPDGSRLVFVATDSSGKSQLWIRALDSFGAQPLPGTDGASQPCWSPDGRFLAFYADGSLKKIAVSGGPAQTLTRGFPQTSGGTWSPGGVVLFAKGPIPVTIQRVSADGGTETPVATLDASGEEIVHAWPQFLPDGTHFLYLAVTKTGNGAIYVGSLDSKERTLLLNASSNALYSPPGYLLYHREGTLMAQPFDTERIQLSGEPVPIAEGLQVDPEKGHAAFAASENGVLAYRGDMGTPLRTLVWVDRTGREQAVAAPPRAYNRPRLSPDGQRVVVEIGPQIWLHDLTRGGLTRFTFEGTGSQNPLWTPDGKRIVFSSVREGPPNLFWQLADGSGGLERLTTSEQRQHATSLSPDGQLLVFHETYSLRNISVLRLSDRKAQPFLGTPFNEGNGTFSPDGRWLAYVSDESGRPEIYVQPYPGPGGKWQISTEGGTEPAWNRNGRELFYRSGNKMMAVETTTQPTFTAANPRVLFEGEFLATSYPELATNYDVSADGQRFLMVKQGEQVPSQINVVQNWQSALGARERR